MIAIKTRTGVKSILIPIFPHHAIILHPLHSLTGTVRRARSPAPTLSFPITHFSDTIDFSIFKEHRSYRKSRPEGKIDNSKFEQGNNKIIDLSAHIATERCQHEFSDPSLPETSRSRSVSPIITHQSRPSEPKSDDSQLSLLRLRSRPHHSLTAPHFAPSPPPLPLRSARNPETRIEPSTATGAPPASTRIRAKAKARGSGRDAGC